MSVVGSEHFHEELKKLGRLHDRKQADYGTHEDPFANVRASEDFGIPAWVGCMVRANDKIRRIQTYSKGADLRCESVEDSLQDLAVYAVIALCLLKEEDMRSELSELAEMAYTEMTDGTSGDREREAVDHVFLARPAGGGGRILRPSECEGEEDQGTEESSSASGA